jgi:hypothetical protein
MGVSDNQQAACPPRRRRKSDTTYSFEFTSHRQVNPGGDIFI